MDLDHREKTHMAQGSWAVGMGEELWEVKQRHNLFRGSRGAE